MVSIISLVLKKKKLILTEHGIINRRRHWYYNVIEKFIYSRYETVISVSNEVNINLLNWLNPKDTKKFIIIQNGIDLNRFIYSRNLNLRQQYGLAKKTILLLTVARLSNEKNLEKLIESFDHLGSDYVLFILGEGILFEKLNLIVKELKLLKRVFLLGFKENVQDYYRSVDGFVSSSHNEGFGIAALEAWAAELPLFLSNIPTFKEIFGESAIYFNQNSSNDIALTIQNYYLNQESSIIPKNNTAIRRFLIQKQIDSINQVYSTLLNQLEVSDILVEPNNDK
jgi:glycosyltransferase involved in cell wall biosynthesis